MQKAKIYTDGGARGNPGPAGIGVVIMDEKNKIISRHKAFIGETTNNQAEYRAVILALAEAQKLKIKNIDFYLDSLLVVEQLNQNYKIKDKELGKLFVRIWNLRQGFSKITFTYIPREKNIQADELVNEAIDEGKKN